MSGLVISIGGLQESLQKASLAALLEYMREKGEVKEQESRENDSFSAMLERVSEEGEEAKDLKAQESRENDSFSAMLERVRSEEGEEAKDLKAQQSRENDSFSAMLKRVRSEEGEEAEDLKAQQSRENDSFSAMLKRVSEEGEEAKDLKAQRSRESAICDDILWILKEYKKCDRVIVPCLNTIKILFEKSKIFLNQEAYTLSFYAGVMDSLAIELRVSKEFKKLNAGLEILGNIASVSDHISTQAFTQLVAFLGHRYPNIRKAAAVQLYLALLQNGILVKEDKIKKVTDIILVSCWEDDMESTKSQRLELCELAGLDHEVVFKTRNRTVTSDIAGKKKDKTTASDENASYSSLVDSSGF